MKTKLFLSTLCVALSLAVFGQNIPVDSIPNKSSDLSNVEFFAPNAFTPDGDYSNDTWRVFIEGIDIYDFHLSIYDRSGQVVWESYDSDAEWDGSCRGYEAPNGIYVYVIDTKDALTDRAYQSTGFITILR